MVWTSKDGPKTLPLCSDCAHRKPCDGCPYQKRAKPEKWQRRPRWLRRLLAMEAYAVTSQDRIGGHHDI